MPLYRLFNGFSYGEDNLPCKVIKTSLGDIRVVLKLVLSDNYIFMGDGQYVTDGKSVPIACFTCPDGTTTTYKIGKATRKTLGVLSAITERCTDKYLMRAFIRSK